MGNVAMFLASVGFGGLLFTLPLFLQGIHGIPASQAGTVMAMHAAGIIVTTIAGPKAVGFFGARKVLAAGLLGSGLTTFAFAFTDQATSLVVIGTILFAAGGSFGLTVVPLQTVPFRGMKQELLARGTSILSVVRQLGIAIGVAAVAVPLGHTAGAAGFAIAFVLAGLVTVSAVSAVGVLRKAKQE